MGLRHSKIHPESEYIRHLQSLAKHNTVLNKFYFQTLTTNTFTLQNFQQYTELQLTTTDIREEFMRLYESDKNKQKGGVFKGIHGLAI
jgi:hypothetical protein